MIYKLCRITAGGLLIGAAIGKSLMFNTFVNEIIFYGYFYGYMAHAAAILILAMEILYGFMLMTDRFYRRVSPLAIGLLCAFTLVKLSGTIRGLDMTDCNCLGGLMSLPLWASFALGGFMIGLILLGLKGQPEPTAFSWRNVWNKIYWGATDVEKTRH